MTRSIMTNTILIILLLLCNLECGKNRRMKWGGGMNGIVGMNVVFSPSPCYFLLFTFHFLLFTMELYFFTFSDGLCVLSFPFFLCYNSIRFRVYII